MGEEFPPRAAAAEDVLVACDVGLCRFGKPREVHRERYACSVARVGGADRICGEEAQVLPQVDVAVVVVSRQGTGSIGAAVAYARIIDARLGSGDALLFHCRLLGRPQCVAERRGRNP